MKKLKKDITFIYMDSSEKAAYEPIADEARKRGYIIHWTDNKFEKCEIGFYCQHINFPQYSKFSLIMLHDIIQQYSNWPDLWYTEPWNKYDIGILPSDQWVNNWNQCSQWLYSRPKYGVFKIGWSKADAVATLKAEMSREDYYIKYHLDINKKTVLYAPAWENDGKQNDFVKAMQKLDINILIKQGPWFSKKWQEARPDIGKNILEMKRLHQGLPNVTILDPSLNIFEAIAVSDILVSEESSTMCEAAMMSIPAISVSDWLIPDTVPSRYPKCDYEFAITTTKRQLAECVDEVLKNYDFYHEKAVAFADATFSNIGKTSTMIMDIIDDCVADRPIRYQALQARKAESVPLKKNCFRIAEQLHRTMYANWKVQIPLFRMVWDIGKKIKNSIKKNVNYF